MILCCGESLIDMIPELTIKGGSGFVPHAGGAIFNTAIGMGRLECRVGLMSGMSTDIFGQQLMAELTTSNVDTSNVILSDRPTCTGLRLSHRRHSPFSSRSTSSG